MIRESELVGALVVSGMPKTARIVERVMGEEERKIRELSKEIKEIKEEEFSFKEKKGEENERRMGGQIS